MTTAENELKQLMLASQDGDSAAHRALLERLSRHLRGYYKSKLARAGRGAAIYKIGTATNNKVTLDTLVGRDPQPAFAHYACYSMLGDGTARGVGWLQAEWRWKFISLDEMVALRSYCTGTSSTVYITTPNNDGDWTGYSATMIWPQITEPLHGDYAEDFVIEYVELVAAGGTT